MMTRFMLAMLAVAACGDDEPMECRMVDQADFGAKSGWEAASYAPKPTELGCYPYSASATDTFGSFISMRTSATPQMSVDSCAEVFANLNCGTFVGDAGTLTFNLENADRLSMKVTGDFNGISVDSTFFFNPCQPGCLAAVTLKTIDGAQQKVCEIPSQNSECLFPDAAHTVTFGRVGVDSIELRLAGQSFPLERSN